MTLSEIITLGKMGYKKKDIDELLAKAPDSVPTEPTAPADVPITQDVANEPEPQTVNTEPEDDYKKLFEEQKKLLEEQQKQIEDLQKRNSQNDISGNSQTVDPKQILADFYRR